MAYEKHTGLVVWWGFTRLPCIINYGTLLLCSHGCPQYGTGERVAGQLLGCLLTLPADKLKDSFRAASATPALVAMLGTPNEGLRSQARH
eukprot:59566-Prymnesium_polylepis.1